MKIIVDLTDLAAWKASHLTGIQKVILNTSLALMNSKADYGFFAFDASSNTFFEICPLSVANVTEQGAQSLDKKDLEFDFTSATQCWCLGGTWQEMSLLPILKSRLPQACRLIQFVHDVTPIKVPHVHFPEVTRLMKEWLPIVYSTCDGIVTNSRFSKQEIVSVASEEKFTKREVSVVRLGDPVSPEILPSIENKRTSNFILAVGSFEPRKNYISLYSALKLLKTNFLGSSFPRLVIAGSKAWLTDDIRSYMLKDPELVDCLEWRSSVSEQELLELYQNAAFTIYPSVYEGWGLPVAESVVQGTFCITSGVSSMPEIAGNLVDYFNPFDTGEMAEKIALYWNDRDLLVKKTEHMRRDYKSVSWDVTFEQILSFGLTL